MGERCVECLVSKTEGKSLLGRPRRKWKYNTEKAPQGVVRGLVLNLSVSALVVMVFCCESDNGNAGCKNADNF